MVSTSAQNRSRKKLADGNLEVLGPRLLDLLLGLGCAAASLTRSARLLDKTGQMNKPREIVEQEIQQVESMCLRVHELVGIIGGSRPQAASSPTAIMLFGDFGTPDAFFLVNELLHLARALRRAIRDVYEPDPSDLSDDLTLRQIVDGLTRYASRPRDVHDAFSVALNGWRTGQDTTPLQSETRPGADSKGLSPEVAAKKALAILKDAGVWRLYHGKPSIKWLAEKVGCHHATLEKAIEETPRLKRCHQEAEAASESQGDTLHRLIKEQDADDRSTRARPGARVSSNYRGLEAVKADRRLQ